MAPVIIQYSYTDIRNNNNNNNNNNNDDNNHLVPSSSPSTSSPPSPLPPHLTSSNLIATPEHAAVLDAFYRRVHRAEQLCKTNPKEWKELCTCLIDQERVVVLEILEDGADHLLEMHLAKGSRELRRRAIARWLSFCHLLSINPIIKNIEESLSLRMFVYFLGAAWINSRKAAEDNRGLSHGYVAGLLSSIRQWHIGEGHCNPLDFDKITSKVLIGLKRVTGDTYKPTLPVSKIQLQFILKFLKAKKTVKASIIAAAIATMFVFLLRVSEVAESTTKRGLDAAYLRNGDIRFENDGSEDVLERHSVVIGLRNTKSEQTGLVERDLPHTRRNDVYDILFHTKTQNDDLARRRNMTPNQLAALPLFNINGVPLQRADIVDAIKEALSSKDAPAGPDVSRFSSHSLRKGGATELLRISVDIATIKWLGRWKSMAWLLYANVTDDCVKRAGRGLANALFD